MEHPESFRQWVLLELMGHRRVAGFLSEQEIAGQAFLRLDIPASDDSDDLKEGTGTQYYSPNAVYSITPVDKTTAYLCAQQWVELPVQSWELKAIYLDAREKDPIEEEEEDES